MTGLKRVVVGPFLVLVLVVAGLAVSQAASAADGSVVINEIMYKPATVGEAEFIELYNPGDTDVDLTGHTLENTVVHGSLSGILAAGSYGLVTQDGFDAAAEWPGATLLGTYTDGLSGSGDTVIIRDANGDIVDQVDYEDSGAWPNEPDAGDGASLELIDAASDNNVGSSWAGTATVNTPGAVNSVTLTPPAPPITNVVATPLAPAVNQDITVVANVPGGGPAPLLFYVVGFGSESSVPMADDGVAPDVTAGDGVFAATIPGQSAGELVRYRILAPGNGNEFPDSDGRNYEGVVVNDPTELPSSLVDIEWFIPEVDYDAMFNNKTEEVIIFGSVLAIDGVVYDNMEVKIRGGTYARENLDKQALSFDFASGFDLSNPDLAPYPIDEFALISARGWTFGRALSSWSLYEGAGFPKVNAQHVKVRRNGEFYGLYRFSEKLDGAWRDASGIDGGFYKTVVPGFNNPSIGFEKKQPDDDIAPVEAFAALINSPASAQKNDDLWDTLDVPNAVNMVAVTTIVGHFDSHVHNFYLHEDTEATGRWQIYPWDLNNTWTANGSGCSGSELSLDCVDSPLWESILDVPEFEEMVDRRIRTLLEGPAAPGVLEDEFTAYHALLSSAEADADNAAWTAVASYQTPSLHNGRIAARRNSFLSQAGFPASQPATPGIVINEIHHSGGVDFLELYNPTSDSVDLSDWVVTGADAVIPGGTVMLPGDYLILTKSIPEFEAEYPNAPNTVLVEAGGLKGGGELIEITTAAGDVIDSVDYNNGATGPWPSEPNVGAVSLSLFDPADDNADGSQWGISVAAGGTPGAVNDTVESMPEPPPAVVINEIHYNPLDGGVEFIELYNDEDTAVDIEGWNLDGMITFPEGSTILSKGYFVATANLPLFQTIYPGIAAVEWTAGETLSGGGEGVDLITDLGVVVDDLTYTDDPPWPGKHLNFPSPDGEGPSMELIDPALDNSEGASWETSLANGSPGATNMVLDETAPVVSSLTPASGESLQSGFVDVTAEVSDVGGSGVDRVQIYVRKLSTGEYWDGSAWVPAWSWVAATPDGAGSWSIPSVDLTEPGDYLALVWAWDVQGNAANYTVNPQSAFTVDVPDVVPPVVEAVSPVDGAVVGSDLVDISATVTDNESGVQRVRIYVRKNSTGEYWDGSAWVSNWSWVLADLGASGWTIPDVDVSDAGTYRVLVWAWDVEGNLANYSDNPQSLFSTAADDTAPVVTALSPTDGATVSGLVDVTADVSDADSGVDRVRIYVKKNSTSEFWNGSEWVSTWSWVAAADDGTGSWSIPDVDMSDAGTYRVLVWAWDLDNNRANYTDNPQSLLTVQALDVDPPVVSSVSPQDGAVVPSGVVDVSAQVADVGSGVDRVRILIRKNSTGEYWDGSEWVSNWSWVLAADDGLGSWVVPEVDVSDDGTYRVLIWAWDTENNLSSFDMNPASLFTVNPEII